MTLSRLCLKVIKSNLYALVSDYLSPNGKIPPHHFEFLQKKYSKQLLLSLVMRRYPIPDHYYKFLINVHLKEIDSEVRKCCTKDILIQRLIEIGESISVLDLSGSTYSECDIHYIISLVPNVEELDLSGTDANDGVFETINYHTPLRCLNISNCNISDAGLERLCERDEDGWFHLNHKLKHLKMYDTKVTEEGVMFSLMKFPSLETLDHENIAQVIYLLYIFYKHSSAVTLDTAPRLNLTSLNVCEASERVWPRLPSRIREHEEIFLAEMLDSLVFLCPKVSSLSISNLRKAIPTSTRTLFSNLQEVSITSYRDWIDLEKIDFTSLLESTPPLLKRVYLKNGKLSTNYLFKCSQLEKLSLYYVELEPLTDNQHNSFSSMTSLDFFMFDSTDDEIENTMLIIASSPNLVSLKVVFSISVSAKWFIDTICTCKCIGTLKNFIAYNVEFELPEVQKLLSHAKELSGLSFDYGISNKSKKEIKSLLKADGRSLSFYWGSSDSHFNIDEPQTHFIYSDDESTISADESSDSISVDEFDDDDDMFIAPE